MVNPRIPKLADQTQMIVAETLAHKIKDPRLGFVTVTDVRYTPDGREATIFYSVLGEDLAGSAAALESAKGLIRSTVAKRIGMKFAPTLSFVLDASFEVAKDMDDLLARVQAEDAQKAKAAEGAKYAGEANPYNQAVESNNLSEVELEASGENLDNEL